MRGEQVLEQSRCFWVLNVLDTPMFLLLFLLLLLLFGVFFPQKTKQQILTGLFNKKDTFFMSVKISSFLAYQPLSSPSPQKSSPL